MKPHRMSVRERPAELTSRREHDGRQRIFAGGAVAHRFWRRLLRSATWFWRQVIASGAAGMSLVGPTPCVWGFGTPGPADAGPFERRALDERSFSTRLFVLEVRRLLAGLGSAPGAVATTLGAAGVHAGPEGAAGTPVTRYLHAVLGTEPDVQTVICDGHMVRVVQMSGSTVAIAVPPAVSHFIGAYGHGCYPELAHRPRGTHGAQRRGSAC
jgi:hypothetical protein